MTEQEIKAFIREAYLTSRTLGEMIERICFQWEADRGNTSQIRDDALEYLHDLLPDDRSDQ